MRWLLLSVLVLVTVSVAQAQSSGATTASIIGKVKDEQGGAVADTTIIARQIGTNFARTIQTGEDGSYLMVLLPPGGYEVTAEAFGFARKLRAITLTVGTTALCDFTLSAGGASEVIEVKASGVLEPDKTEQSTVINENLIAGLPINRRNYLEFALTTAGVVRDRLPLQGEQPNSGLNFNGQNARQNNITIDGVDNNDNFSGAVRSSYSQEAVQEFQVVSNSFSAEFGRAQGGVINIVTKSGANNYHGNLFFLNRNDELSAQKVFAIGAKPPFEQYQYGATLSGPIKRDRLFFFTAFERLSIADTLDILVSPATIAALNRRGIPARRGSIPFSEGTASLLTRADMQLSANDRVTARYNYTGIYNGALEPFGGLRTESVAGVGRLRDDNLSVANTYVSVARNLVNETRFLFARRDFNVQPADPNGPLISISAEEGNVSAGRGVVFPNVREERIYQFLNNTSVVRGRNQLKFGIDYLHIDLPEEQNVIPNVFGGVAFFQPIILPAPLPSFSSLESFDPALRTPQQQAFLSVLSRLLPSMVPGFPLLDLTRLSLPTLYGQGFGNPFIGLKYDYISAFVQNDLRLTSRLTTKLGLRYDQERVQYVPKNRGNLSPRVSFAYQVNERSRFHAAYGIFHGVTPFAPVLIFALSSVNGVKVPVLPFPFSILPYALPERRFPESMTVPATIPVIPQLGIEQAVQSDFKNGYTQQVNVGFDYQLDQLTLLSVSYQYVRGLKLYLSRDINPVVRPIAGDPLNSRINGRIDPTRGTIQDLESAGDSYYNALSLELKRNFGGRFSLLANYTFSKTLDNFVDYRVEIATFQNPLNLSGERGFSLQDVRNRFVISGLWLIDYGKRPLFKGYQLSAIVTAESGRPYNLRTGIDLDMNGDLQPGDRPLGIARNAGITPGFAALDMRLARRVKINERLSLEGFVEAFNLLNRVNISNDFENNIFPPNADGTFTLPGQENGRFVLPRERFVSAFPPRRAQFGVRFSF